MPGKPTILYEDNHLLVLNKPAELPTMGALAGKPTLLDWGRQYLKVKYHKPGNVYLGVVSRLDAAVSGVIVFARTSKAAARLNEQFRGRTVEKVYWAVVHGDVPQREGTWEDWLHKNDARHRMEVARAGTGGAVHAVLSYRVESRIAGGFTRLTVELRSGRKHQIRVQCAARGLPIVGDRKYGSTCGFAAGIALHSRRLELQHPVGGAALCFEAPVPEGWVRRGFTSGGPSTRGT
ncbi:MAG: RluA family pseudouridine synthase [Pirellulaceae bacterium]|nr:RluA family pseudouridine synthase [Planctomycetales bacterium]